jgi:hypothetical protein
MMLATFFAYQQQRSVMQTRLDMVRNEVETAATGVAVDRLEEIGVMAFDDATKGGDEVASANFLTSAAAFVNDAPPIDDIDDFDNSIIQSFRVYAGDTLWFGVEADVQYANEVQTDQAVADPAQITKYKMVTVKVYSLSIANVDTVRLSQTFSCGSKCAW